MTVEEMLYSFVLKGKSLDRPEIDVLRTDDIIQYLNYAQTWVVQDLINKKDLAQLRPVIISGEYTGATNPTFNTSYTTGIAGSKCVDLSGITSLISPAPSILKYKQYIRSNSKITRSAVPAVTDKYFANEDIDPDTRKFYETNTNNIPIFANPKTFIEGNYLIIIPDGYSTISSIQVTYVRDAKILNLSTVSADLATSSELPVGLHDAIVDIALKLAKETININDIKKQNDGSRNAS